MGIKLITGTAGEEHVTAADFGSFNAGTINADKVVLQTAEKFAYELITNNLIKIKSGDLLNQGRHFRIDVNDYVECEIDNGLQSVLRNDIIACRYKKNIETGIETAIIVVIKGISGDTAIDPALIEGNILNGATQDDFPLYRVKLSGLNVQAIQPMFKIMQPMSETQAMLGNADISKIGNTITEAISSLNNNLTTKSDATHLHDGRYYTEFEIEGLLNEKQPLLTNPLTQANVVDNLTSISTVAPLSAAQGRALDRKMWTIVQHTEYAVLIDKLLVSLSGRKSIAYYDTIVTTINGKVAVPTNAVSILSVQNCNAASSNDNITSWLLQSKGVLYYNKAGTNATQIRVVYTLN